MLKFKKLKFVVILILILVVGCTKVNPAEDIYHHLEKAVSLEAAFEQQQEPLSKAENDEYELYDQILGLADLEEIKVLAVKAEELAVSRKSMIETERDSIDEAFQEFSQITPIIETIENEELLKIANELVAIMDKRYQTYMELYNEYKVAIDLDLELYKLIQKEDLTIDELEAQHEKVNSSYEMVNGFKDQFNQYTIQYNDLKRNFYDLADLEVVYN
ncbi:YkyA family protein [Anaerobacillus isosaccharinicus]|uniref:YkyA family protein n=1 Tax=Anaerobacillus isosaccharinicus TaxID=1532552 RepID=A0A7S7L4L6_9BACI|nr:YkyA family protein [Anaerobacillus isosaccharinicus]MBA5587513.1 YkyA family protein [Anaerobacillus isosaccharinicus]QOY34305.1 YkyA family protein [Anaerobacillus isosaccharinicus]